MIYRIEDLRHTYAGRTVLDIRDLSVRPGEILALVGPSGAGKSTLLRLLNFLETPSSGRIIYRGRPASGRVPLDIRRQVTTVFQRPVLLRGSVHANVAYALALRRLHQGDRVDEMLESVGLQLLAQASAHTLSGGEMQRVALARALVIQPQVLLLDEPTANLDPYNVTLIEDAIRRDNANHGTTVVLVTHNVFQARRLAHRVGLMQNGELVELGTSPDFFDCPRDARTRAFVRGEMVY